jgi:hypothetical protein
MKKIILIILLLPLFANARKFYFSSSTGNDSYSVSQAQNSTTPWKTLIRLQTFGNSGSAAAGDTFLFKRGDLFDNGYNGTNGNFGSMKWWSIAGYTCPSGTPTNPIVFTSYGDVARPKPNFLFPYPSTSVYNNRYVLSFEGISNVVIDGLQFNDYRFSDTAKVTTAYTSSALLLGEYGAINTVENFKVTNCIFNRVGYAMLSAGRNFEISYNTATNLKSVGDTSGATDIGADFMVAFGAKYRIHHNFVSGCWFYTSGTGGGKGGGVFEVGDNFDSSFIGYNTFIDNDRCFEGGSIFDANVGCNDDTIAYNKFINNGGVSYIHQGDAFGGKNSNWHFWNNVIVENAYSRFTGINFGSDLPAFDTDTLGNVNVIYNQSFWAFPLWGGGSLNCGYYKAATCGTTGKPLNPSIPFSQCPSCNNSGYRVFQYTSDANVPTDTLYDIRNNIIWDNNNLTIFYDTTIRTKFKHRNNVLRLSGGSVSGGLAPTDILTTNKIFVDTANSNPFYWDYHLGVGSPAIDNGYYTGVSPDFNNAIVTNPPSRGIYNYAIPTSIPTILTLSPVSITSVSAIVGFNVTNEGGTSTYERGLIYSTSPITDTTSGTKITFPFLTGTGSYTFTLAGLSPSTIYHLRAFALNSVGVSYGSDFTFSTLSGIFLAGVNANSPTSITSNSAIIGGDVKSDGNSSVYRRGLIYSTSHITDTTSTVGGGKTINGSGLGTYSSTISSLTNNTTYYVKAFALNSAGVSYSSEVYFSTSGTPPSANSFRTRKRFIQKL